MRIRTILFMGCFLLAAGKASFAAEELEAEQKIAAAEAEVDMTELDSIEQRVAEVIEETRKIEGFVDTKFTELMNDVTSGVYNKDGYLAAIEKPIHTILGAHDTTVSPAAIQKVQRIQDRAKLNGDDTVAKRAQKVLDDAELLKYDLEKYECYRNKEKNNVSLTNTLFQSRVDAVISKINENTKALDRIVRIEENKLEYFLVDDAKKMYPKIQKGEKPACVSTKKKIIRDALIRIRDGETYDVEKDLREGAGKYNDSDSIILLYSYVLLINWHDTNSLKKGYDYLSQAYDNLETEQLAFNLVRVGLRMGVHQQERLLKIIDHVVHRKDYVIAGELGNMLLYTHIKKGDYAKADRYLKELKEESYDLSKHFSPVIKSLIYLKQCKFEAIAGDVAKYDREKQVMSFYKNFM